MAPECFLIMEDVGLFAAGSFLSPPLLVNEVPRASRAPVSTSFRRF
jgi:hypothetical protein